MFGIKGNIKMEAIKSVIWNREPVEINGKRIYKYLIGTILLTDTEIDGIENSDNVVMSANDTDFNHFSNAYSCMKKYDPPYNLGDLYNAVISLSEMTPDDLIPRGQNYED